MPPRFKFTREAIVEAALELTEAQGPTAVTARAVAARLESSPKVIFSLFRNMEELQQAVKAAAYGKFQQALETAITGGEFPPYKSMGMGYIRFARQERELFKLLFLCDRTGEDQGPQAETLQAVAMIRKGTGLSREQAERLHLELWICVHGIATMEATSFLHLEEPLISQILSDTYLGIRDRLLAEEEKEHGSHRNQEADQTIQGSDGG